MDIEKIKRKISCLLEYMRDTGYSAMYIDYVKKMADWVIENAITQSWESYSDVEAHLKHLWTNSITFRRKQRELRIIRQYVEEGIVPNGHKHYHRPTNYDFLNEEFKTITDTSCKLIGTKRKNCTHIKYALSSFFKNLQNQGATSLDLITEDNVLNVFKPGEQPGRSHTTKQNVEYGLKACIPVYGQRIVRIISYLPSILRRRKNIQYLTDDEISLLQNTLDNDKTISLQDKAVITIAMYTGLRGGDISSLTFDNLDWNNDLIRITQNKTGRELIIPLRAVVGNAIFDYLSKERPKCSEPYLFLTLHVPYRRLHTANLDAICTKVMLKAGIRTSKTERKSIHLFRHRLATSLLQSDIQQPVISATLGHSSPATLDHYLSAEFRQLKECALSIKDFPVGKEVFGS